MRFGHSDKKRGERMAMAGNAPDFEHWRSVGDDEADPLVESLIAASDGKPLLQAATLEALLLRLFAWTPSAAPIEPAQAEAFLRRTDVLPAWFVPQRDLPRVRNAQDLFDRFKLTAALVLGCASLPPYYAHRQAAHALHVSRLPRTPAP